MAARHTGKRHKTEGRAVPPGAPGGEVVADDALVALTLLIAESRPEEKDVLSRVVVNFINRRNA